MIEKRLVGEISLRPMQILDIPSVVKVEQKSFTTPWSDKMFLDELKDNSLSHYLVITVNDNVIGYCGAWLILDEIHITNIAILPEYRGMGLGRYLIASFIGDLVEEGFTKATLEVRVSNKEAQKLYTQLGFDSIAIRPSYYSDNGEDALIMWVILDEQSDSCFRD